MWSRLETALLDGTAMRVVACTLALTLALAVAVTCAGCSSGQAFVSSQAQYIRGTQAARFGYYDAEHARCLEGSESFEAYGECMTPSRAAASAVDAYAAALESAQAVLTAAGEESFMAMLPCLVRAASDAARALEAARLPIPADVFKVAEMLPGGEECGQ